MAGPPVLPKATTRARKLASSSASSASACMEKVLTILLSSELQAGQHLRDVPADLVEVFELYSQFHLLQGCPP
jgi:hypothetical protein